MEFLEVKWYDDDLLKMIIRLLINVISIFVIVRLIYYPAAKRKDYLFTYILISFVIFFICFALKKFTIEAGMALALFALFGIIRYRTDTIPIKEMTYLFLVIGLSVINALANKQMSYAELGFINASTIAVTYGLERVWLLKHEAYKVVVYEKIEMIRSENHAKLVEDLEYRTGLKVNRIEIGKIDFLRDTANIKVYYYQDEQDHPQFEDNSE